MDKGQSKKEERPEGIWQQGKPDMKRTLFIAFVVFLTFSSCILFFFVLYRYNGFANYWKNLSGILQPIIFGVVLAYLLNPIMKFIERNVSRYLLKRMKDDNKRPKVVRLIGITGALIFLLGLFALLIAAIVPSVTESITSVATSLPDEINSLIDWVNSIAEGDGRFADSGVRAGKPAADSGEKGVEQVSERRFLGVFQDGHIYGRESCGCAAGLCEDGVSCGFDLF